MNNKIKTTKKKKSLVNRISLFLLFVILSPVYLFSLTTKAIHKRHKFLKWKNNKISGEDTILNASISSIDIMEGYEFENFVSSLLFYLGYETKVTPRVNDYGADIIISNSEGVSAVQVKRYSKKVNSSSVREVIEARIHYKTNDAIVITNNFFTEQAEEVAHENGVQLIDRKELEDLIIQAQNILKENNINNPQIVDFDSVNKFRI